MAGAAYRVLSVCERPVRGGRQPCSQPKPSKSRLVFHGIPGTADAFPPVFGAIVIPGLGLLSLISIPYLDKDMETTGVWFPRARTLMALGAVFFGVLGTFIYVVADEYWLDLPG